MADPTAPGPGTPATSDELVAAFVAAVPTGVFGERTVADGIAAVRPLIEAEALRRHATNMRAIEASMRARPDKTGADLIALTCVGAAAQYAEVAASQYETPKEPPNAE